MSRRWGVGALVTGGVVVALAGCGAQVERADGLVLMTHRPDGGGDPIVTGQLGLTETGCVGLLTEEGADVVPAVWPAGTSIADAGDGIELDGELVLLGETVVGSGGFDPTAGIEPPEECAGHPTYAVLWEG